MSRFTGQSVFITGAAGGLGQKLCRGFAAEGVSLGGIDRDPRVMEFVEDMQRQGYRMEAAVGDIGKAALFLASDDAAAITGAMLPEDCGLSAGSIVMTRELTLADL